MEKTSETSVTFHWDSVKNAANDRIKQKLKEMGITYQIAAAIIDMKLPTFQDKIGGRSSWYIEEIAKLCVYLNTTSDELIFGNPLFVTQWNMVKQTEIKARLKSILTAKKDYKLLGKLTAEGFFD